MMAIVLGLGACHGPGGEGADCPPGAKTDTPSGYCVPRYLSLKRGEVYGRQGPGMDYPILFVYHVRGLPVQVVDETHDWRRICDPGGGAAWVSRAMLAGQRTVMETGGAPAAIRSGPSDAAAPSAYLRPKSVADLDQCKGGWCRVTASGVSGWVRAGKLWGLAPQAQCR